MSVNIDQVTDELLSKQTAEYRAESGLYKFALENRWLYEQELDVLTIAKDGNPVGRFMFSPKTRVYTSDGTYEYPKFGIGGHAQLNPYSYGPAIEVNEDYRDQNIGTALLSVGVNISRRRCKSESEKPHYFTIGEVNPNAVDFFKKFGFTIYTGSWISGEMNTDEVDIPDLGL